jgi:hypothetical protein
LRLRSLKTLLTFTLFNMDSPLNPLNPASSLNLGSSPNLINTPNLANSLRLSQPKLSRLNNLNLTNNLTQPHSLSLVKRYNPITSLRSLRRNLHERLEKLLTQVLHLNLNQ